MWLPPADCCLSPEDLLPSELCTKAGPGWGNGGSGGGLSPHFLLCLLFLCASAVPWSSRVLTLGQAGIPPQLLTLGMRGSQEPGTCEWWHPWGRDMQQSHTKLHLGTSVRAHPPASLGSPSILVPLVLAPLPTNKAALSPVAVAHGCGRAFFTELTGASARGLLPARPPQPDPTALEERQSSWG